MARLVEQYGEVWKLSEAKYAKLLKDISLGKEYNLDTFGRSIGVIALCPLDMQPEDAEATLEGHKKGKL